jgi:hypothetical protein
MIEFKWNSEKNRALKENTDRAVCFEDIIAAIQSGGLLDDIEHLNAEKDPHQRVLVVQLAEYVYGVPYVETENGVFLKTIYPSRKLTKEYLKVENDE